MRVALISTVDCRGGAARAAFRLHRGLLALGIHSTMLVQRKTTEDPAVVDVPMPPHAEADFWGFIQEGCVDLNRAGPWNTHFSLGCAGVDLSRHPAIQAADVINLHWVSGFQALGDIRRLQQLGKPLVWTLHDQRPFTGGCHFAFDCRGFESGCLKCPQLEEDPWGLPAAVLADARALLSEENLTIVTPSRWLGAEARRSVLLKDVRVETIPYGLDSTVFRPVKRAEARTSLGLAAEGFYLLFGADYGAERRKGFAELAEALRLCMEDRNFRRACDQGKLALLCFGRPDQQLASLAIPFVSLGYLNEEAELARAYAAADIFLLPSRADNLPCTLIESLACGTPAIAFAVGGIPDLVRDRVHGRLVAPGDSRELAAALLELLDDPDELSRMSGEALARISAGFTERLQAEAYSRLFDELVAAGCPAARQRSGVVEGSSLRRLAPKLADLACARYLRGRPDNPRWRWYRNRLAKEVSRRGGQGVPVPVLKRLLDVSRRSRWRLMLEDLKGWLDRR